MWILRSGDLFAERYRIERQLGSGGMSYVYAAVDEELHERVALKIIKLELVTDENLVSRFKQEVRIARQIQQRNIIRVFDVGRTEVEGQNIYYLSMELLEGADLADWMRSHQTIALTEALDICVQLCDALSAAHSHGVIHRDIKPHNIFINPEGRVKLMDFGISRLSDTTGLTRGSQTMGTPQYMSPEQAQGGKELDSRSDLYSLGVVLYRLCAGRVPFEGKNMFETVIMHIQEPPPPPRQINPQIPEALEDVILTCLKKEPAGRHQSAEELRAALLKVECPPSSRVEITPLGIEAVPTKTMATTPRPSEGAEEPKEVADVYTPATITSRAPPQKPSVHPAPSKPVVRARRHVVLMLLGIAAGLLVALTVTWMREEAVDERTQHAAVPIPETEDLPTATTTVELATPSERPSKTVTSVPVEITPEPEPPPRSVARPKPPPQTGNLSIASVPDGAVLEVDGRRVGSTPWQAELPGGEHRVLVSRPGYLSQDATVTVSAGASTTRTINLIPDKGEVVISANPGTRVYVDGEMAGTVPPVVLTELTTGRHEIRYVIPGYAEFQETVEVAGGQKNQFSHSFPLHGTLRILCEPYASVRLDGEDLGFTPLSIDKVSEGEHRITLSREGHQTIEQTITIRADEVNRFQFKLVPETDPDRL